MSAHKQPALPWAEIRWYETGWITRVGPWALRWHRDDNLAYLSVEVLKTGTTHVGGMTWRKFRQRRRDLRAAP